MDTTRIQTLIAVQHLRKCHVVGDWEDQHPRTLERRHPVTRRVYARVVETDSGASLTVWDHTSRNTVQVLREENWVDVATARQTADHMLKVQGVLFLTDLMEP